MRLGAGLLAVVMLCGCGPKEARLLVLTKPILRDTTVSRAYVCRIHSSQRTEIRALVRGYLEVVSAQEGQRVKEGDVLFKIRQQVLNAAAKRLETESADDTAIKAPFSGRMDRLRMQNGSPVNEGDVLTTLTDNSEIWADFNVPEAHYLEYSAPPLKEEAKQVRLMLANGRMFDQPGRLIPTETKTGNETGTLPLRAVFSNPKDLLRHGQTGNIRLESTIKNALLVPRQSTFEVSDHRCVHVVDKEGVIRQRQLGITHEVGDFFVVANGVSANDTILFDGMAQVHDGEKAGDSTFEEPAKAYAQLKTE